MSQLILKMSSSKCGAFVFTASVLSSLEEKSYTAVTNLVETHQLRVLAALSTQVGLFTTIFLSPDLLVFSLFSLKSDLLVHVRRENTNTIGIQESQL